jgi:hypothetical protein
MTEIQKKKMIKLIHAQKTRSGIDDEAYCSILMGAANVQSSLDMNTVSQFTAVITALNNLLVSLGKAPLNGFWGLGRSEQPLSREAYALKKRAERMFGPDTDGRFGGFIRKLGKNSVHDLSPLEIRKCHGFLTKIERQEER